ncbi:MAG: prepilin-type N-terminal cleavage/methylation domain-containing protein [Candidatus Avelusimicrobium sp.]|uniref:pilin n=1 Tax=Candidatus Avelusimicrobium sp. TaxID=3048833 RepID=UPI003F00D629
MKGFTLIELLVVVLIIGILSAVALPQYQKAVAKSRVAAVIPLVKSVGTARDVYFMANGSFETDSCDNLDVDLPDSTQYFHFSCVDGRDGVNFTKGQVYAHSRDTAKLPSILSERYQDKRVLFCLGHSSGNQPSNDICQSLGGKEQTQFNPGTHNAVYYLLD